VDNLKGRENIELSRARKCCHKFITFAVGKLAEVAAGVHWRGVEDLTSLLGEEDQRSLLERTQW